MDGNPTSGACVHRDQEQSIIPQIKEYPICNQKLEINISFAYYRIFIDSTWTLIWKGKKGKGRKKRKS